MGAAHRGEGRHTGGARRSEDKGQDELRASGRDDDVTIAKLRSSCRRHCHVAVVSA